MGYEKSVQGREKVMEFHEANWVGIRTSYIRPIGPLYYNFDSGYT